MLHDAHVASSCYGDTHIQEQERVSPKMRNQLKLGGLGGVNQVTLQGSPEVALWRPVYDMLQLHSFSVVTVVQKLSSGITVMESLQALYVFKQLCCLLKW